MIQLESNLHFVQEILFAADGAQLRYFQCNARFMDRVSRPIDIREWARRNPSQNPVFTEFLPGTKQYLISRYSQTISNSPAAPMPPPTHIVQTTNFALRRLPSINA